MSKQMLLLFLLLLSFLGPIFSQPDSSETLFYTNQLGSGVSVVSDDLAQIYVLSDDMLADRNTQSVVRQITADGNLIWAFSIPTSINTEGKKIIETKDGNLLCLYKIIANEGISITKPDSIGLLKLSKNGIPLWEEKIPIHRAAVSSENIVERADSSIVMLSPKIYEDGGIVNTDPYLHLLDKNGKLLKSMFLEGISEIRIRAMNLAEEGNILLGTLGLENGALIAKVDIDAETILWKRDMTVLGTTFNRTYDVTLLEDKSSYGIISNYLNGNNDSLSGIHYFRVDLAGNILNQQQLAVIANTVAYPRLLKSCEGQLEVIFNQTDNSNNLPLMRIKISPEGNIIDKKMLTIGSTTNYFFDYTQLNENQIVGIGTGLGETAEFNTVMTVFSKDECEMITSVEVSMKNPIISIFPNPSADYLHLKSASTAPIPLQNEDILIFTSSGQLVRKIANASLNEPININSLYSGIYYLTILTEHKIHRLKFIKK